MKILVKVLCESESEFETYIEKLYGKRINLAPCDETVIHHPAIKAPVPEIPVIVKEEPIIIPIDPLPEKNTDQAHDTRLYAEKKCENFGCDVMILPTGPQSKYCPECLQKRKNLREKLEGIQKNDPKPISRPGITRDGQS